MSRPKIADPTPTHPTAHLKPSNFLVGGTESVLRMASPPAQIPTCLYNGDTFRVHAEGVVLCERACFCLPTNIWGLL